MTVNHQGNFCGTAKNVTLMIIIGFIVFTSLGLTMPVNSLYEVLTEIELPARNSALSHQ